MSKFKVGDRVKTPQRGEGVIIAIEDDLIGVVHDIPYNGFHSLVGRCANDRGWYYRAKSLEHTVYKPPLTKLELICDKIKYLEQKFKNRKELKHAESS